MEKENNSQVERNPDGTVKGGALNPTGYNGFQRGMPWKMRVLLLEEKFPTLEDLFQFFDIDAADNFKPNKLLRAMPHRDATILMGMFEEFMKGDRLAAREAYWNRHDGKPTQRTELTGAEGGPISVTDESRAAVVGKLLPEVAVGSSEGETAKSD